MKAGSLGEQIAIDWSEKFLYLIPPLLLVFLLVWKLQMSPDQAISIGPNQAKQTLGSDAPSILTIAGRHSGLAFATVKMLFRMY